MKKILYSVLSVLLLFLGSACERDDYEFRATANITVINAASGNGAVKVNPGAGSGFPAGHRLPDPWWFRPVADHPHIAVCTPPAPTDPCACVPW